MKPAQTQNDPRMSLQTIKVLGVFLRNPESDHYGLEVGKEANLPSGTMYPILARLEQAGWLESGWENIDPKIAGRKPRRYYRFTEEGLTKARVVAREASESLRSLRSHPA